MISEPGVDHPDKGTAAQVAVVGRDVTVDCRVVSTHDGVLVMRPTAPDEPAELLLRPGDQVEVSWARVLDRRMVPATVIDRDGNGRSRWRLRTTGPVRVEQRRTTVRARVGIPVVVADGGRTLVGATQDLSEGGALIDLRRDAEPPRSGTVVDVHLDLGEGELSARAEVIRSVTRELGGRSISVRFVALRERDEDRIRRRVFQALREERARLHC